MSDRTPTENCWKKCLYIEVSNAQNKFIKLTFILIKVRETGEMEDYYLIFTLVFILLKIALNEKLLYSAFTFGMLKQYKSTIHLNLREMKGNNPSGNYHISEAPTTTMT